MRKKILFAFASILIILIICLFYLSIYGIKTDSFNKFINSKVKDYNSKLTLQIDEVFIKLNLSEGAINVTTKKAVLTAESNPIKISNIDINLNLIKFLKNENSIKNIKIKSSNSFIKDITSFLNVIDYNLSQYVFYSQINKGLLSFELDAKFDNFKQDIISYFITGSVNNAELNVAGYENLNDINFNFQAQKDIVNIFDLRFNYNKISFLSQSLEVKSKKTGEYNVKGDIENIKTFINPKLLFEHINIKQDYLSGRDVLFESKNIFSFEFKQNKKIKNLKIDSVLNFDKIFFNEEYQNIIFLKEGTIYSNYENGLFTADLNSNFVFFDDSDVNNNFKNNNLKLLLKRKNNQKIQINGNISNGKTLINPKIFLNLIDSEFKHLSDKKINFESDNTFEFEINDNKVENYLINSEINLDKLELNKKIQDIFYLNNIKTKLIFADKLLKIDLKSNYSFFDKNLNEDSNTNLINLKFDKNHTKISDLEIFVLTDNNNIDIKEFKKYIKFKEIDNFVEDQIINLNSNFKLNASLDDKFNIKKIAIKSDLDFDNLYINYKSNLIKKYLKNYENKFSIKNPKILFEYTNDLINLQLDGKYLLNDKEDNFFVKFKGNKIDFEFYSLLDLDNSYLNLDQIQYSKKKNIQSKLEVLINNSNSRLNLEKINFTENENNILIKNLVLSNDFKMQSLDNIDINFLNKNGIKNKFKIKKNSNNYNLIGSQVDGEKIIEILLKRSSQNKVSNFFDNISTSVILNLDKIYLEKNEYLNKFDGEFEIKNNKLILARANAVLNKENEFSYSYRTTSKDEKITNILIKEPKPFINNYKFIKGFEEGELKLNSIKIDNTSRSNLKITNFKVKEVPVLAKILTLASLQGIADLLTGEGIRFDEFEMDFKSKKNLTEIDEMYALGPAISIMMEGYIEKDGITSLRGTLVPATTINKTISKIPLIGDILVGSKTGEGVFGVSFKIKGPPNGLKSTVNPIKTLTPRFITRTLENLKGS